MELSECLKTCADNGVIGDYYQIAPNCWVIALHKGWSKFARCCSVFLPGKWHVHPNSCYWQIPFEKAVYFLDSGEHSALKECRAMTETETGAVPGWSWGSCARAFTSWALEPKKPVKADYQTQDGKFIGYRQCYPGKYDVGNYWDMRGCYWQLICRLRSPRLELDKHGRIHYLLNSADSKSKWSHAKQVLSTNKQLRNSVWGTMLGSQSEMRYYSGGEEKTGRGYVGSHYATAALVARSAWELCYVTCQDESAVYAHTDGIVMTGEARPKYWEAMGMTYESKGHGDTHICHHSSFRCGNKSTEWYKQGSRYAELSPRPLEPRNFFHLAWL